MKFYSGIGSRETPPNILELMTSISKKLDEKGYILRSGGADGADTAFEIGSNNKEIYLPWLGFNNNQSELLYSKEAFDIAKEIHPFWYNLSYGAKKLHV